MHALAMAWSSDAWTVDRSARVRGSCSLSTSRTTSRRILYSMMTSVSLNRVMRTRSEPCSSAIVLPSVAVRRGCSRTWLRRIDAAALRLPHASASVQVGSVTAAHIRAELDACWLRKGLDDAFVVIADAHNEERHLQAALLSDRPRSMVVEVSGGGDDRLTRGQVTQIRGFGFRSNQRRVHPNLARVVEDRRQIAPISTELAEILVAVLGAPVDSPLEITRGWGPG